jgi:hypothetical protein
VIKISYFLLKNYFLKILCEYSQVESCFQYLIVTNLIVQSNFCLDASINIYSFLSFEFTCMLGDLIIFIFIFMHATDYLSF